MPTHSTPLEPGLLQMNVTPSIRLLLDSAMKRYADKDNAERMLKQAFDMDPSVLDTYVVFYKFYFYHRMLREAESWAQKALESAAQQGGFDHDWQKLDANSAQWEDADNAERIYLYSLKALTFLRMKQGDLQLPEKILSKLALLDPEDQVGWTVISEMLSRLQDHD